jgi:hypothetical protein
MILTYNPPGISDPPGPPPAMGPAGSLVSDHGTYITRITDEHTADGASFHTHSAAGAEIWNADSRMLLIGQAGGVTRLVRWDGFRGEVQPDPVPIAGEPMWVTGDAIYGVNGSRISQYCSEVRNSPVYTMLDLEVLPATVTPRYAGALTAARGTIACAFGGSSQDTHPFVVIYSDTKPLKYLDLRDSTANLPGENANLKYPVQVAVQALPDNWFNHDPARGGVHSLQLDRSGRYLFMVVYNPKAETWVWDLDTDTITMVSVRASGHQAMGWEAMAGGDGGLSDGWVWRGLHQQRLNRPTAINPTPGADGVWHFDSHFSWNNAQPNILMPVFCATYYTAGAPVAIYQNEILALHPASNDMHVARFCRHYSIYRDGNDFWASPRGSVSPCGRWFAFTSNWGVAGGRTDVYVAHVAAPG